jgi:hypothetical protein
MRRGFLVTAVGLFVASCSGSVLDPYFAPLRPPGTEVTGPVSRGPQPVSVCYSSAATTPERLRQLVADNCEGAVLVSNRADLTVCSLLQPVRAVFQCQRISSTLAEQRSLPVPTLGR